MARAQEKLDGAENMTKNILGKFEVKLEDIRKSRETAGVAVHTKTSSVKQSTIEKVEEAMTDVQTVGKETKSMQEAMAKEMEHMQGTMSELGKVKSNSSEAQMKQMQHDLVVLQQGHLRLMDWRNNDEFKTQTFRSTVERGLNELGRGIVKDGAGQGNDRLDDEVGLQNTLQSLKRGVEDSLAKSNIDGLRKYDFIAGQFQSGMEDVQKAIEVSGAACYFKIPL